MSIEKINIILKYFPELTAKQQEQFAMLEELYKDWNQKINVVSRKDVDELYVRHVLHSLAIAKIIEFKPGNKVLDIGTGGGFPGIPLAIYFPVTNFFLADSIGKKIKVTQEVIDGTGIKNAKAQQIRAEEINDQFDFIVNRAVAPLSTLLHWTKGKFKPKGNHKIKNGLISLKGGDLTEEIKAAGKQAKIYPIADFFNESFFETKKVIYIKG